MAVNQMAVRMAGRDIATALQYINLGISTLERAESTLAVEASFKDDTLALPAAQAKALLRQMTQLADSFEGVNTKRIETYTPAEEMHEREVAHAAG